MTIFLTILICGIILFNMLARNQIKKKFDLVNKRVSIYSSVLSDIYFMCSSGDEIDGQEIADLILEADEKQELIDKEEGIQ